METYIKPQKTIDSALKEVLFNVCQLMGTDFREAMQKTRKREIVITRQVAMYIAKINFGQLVSLAKIGQIMGGKDHATVLHAIKAINHGLDSKDYLVTSSIEMCKHLMTENKADELIVTKQDLRLRIWNGKRMSYGPSMDSISPSWVISMAAVSLYPVQQAIGLYDKLKMEIWEGDIITYRNKKYVVHKSKGCFVYNTNNENLGFMFEIAAVNQFEYDRSDLCEVIGNIYANPELLKQTNYKSIQL
jgi:hypothetical protein